MLTCSLVSSISLASTWLRSASQASCTRLIPLARGLRLVGVQATTAHAQESIARASAQAATAAVCWTPPCGGNPHPVQPGPQSCFSPLLLLLARAMPAWSLNRMPGCIFRFIFSARPPAANLVMASYEGVSACGSPSPCLPANFCSLSPLRALRPSKPASRQAAGPAAGNVACLGPWRGPQLMRYPAGWPVARSSAPEVLSWLEVLSYTHLYPPTHPTLAPPPLPTCPGGRGTWSRRRWPQLTLATRCLTL